jgi:ectoine hydroxylase-related dioxygenase (phytanoyl-CoA dioxygenase family)
VGLTRADIEQYDRDGFLLVDELFSAEEVEVLMDEISGDRVAANLRHREDGSGKTARLSIWHELGNDIWAAASTDPRIVNSVRLLVGEDVSFFHGKAMLKEAHSGGAWVWHQDYGYWYNQGFACPQMISAFVALDPATRENGCLQVLRGSHRLGRIDHMKVGDQTGADPDRVAMLEPMSELVHVKMQPGSVLFFHCNLLHRSDPNESDDDRRSFIMCYTALSNPQLVDERTYEHKSCPVGAQDSIILAGRPS